jgi:hypothetical protein
MLYSITENLDTKEHKMKIIDELKTYFPTYDFTLPISKKSGTFTPFKVKDAKNLGIVLQENNKKLAFSAMVDLLKNNSKGIEIESLCLADAEYLFLQIRSKSIDEIINIVFENNKYSLNIGDVLCMNEKTNNRIIFLNESINVELETPTIKTLMSLSSFEKTDLHRAIIKKIIIKNEIYDARVFVPDEIKEFIENMPLKIMSVFDEFLNEQPKLFYKIKLNDGTDKEVSGLLDFFILR